MTDSGTLIDTSRMAALQRRISLDLTDVPINTAVLAIMDQAKLWLLYRGEAIPTAWRVSVHAKEITVASALVQVLRKTGVDVVSAPGGWLTLTKCTHVSSVAARNDNGVVTGRITDHSTGAPLTGATVVLEGTQLSATANTEGRYRIADVPVGKYSIMARYIGYAASSDTVSVDLGSVVENFALAPSAQPLDQVVVTGTLVPTEVKALPTPITIVTADEIRQQNVMRLIQLFQGQVPGALAWDLPADDHYITLNVRGATSFASQSPKIFVDGIELADPQFAALIDPHSIERIELTRGPQASTLYGSNAIGGVLQIFTKKGRFGLTHPEGEIQASGSLIEKNDGPGVAPRFENSVTLRGGEDHTRYQASAYYRRDGEWTPSYRNTNWNVTTSAENVQGLLTSRISALFSRKVYDRAWYLALRDAGYIQYSKPPFETVDLQTQTFGANFIYVPRPWWRHELVLGYDRWAFDLTQTQPRFTTPDDTLLQVILNHRGKISIFYYTAVSTKLGRLAGATVTAGFNHYSLDGSDGLSPETNKFEGTLTGATTLLRYSSANSGYFAQAQVRFAETAFLTAGVRAETSPGFGRDVGAVVSPRFGVAYIRQLGSAVAKLRASYGESIRAPDPSQNQAFLGNGFEQLYNAELKPERQRGSDIGVDLSRGTRASVSATYYDQDAIGLIAQVAVGTIGDPPIGRFRQQNVGRVKNRGWEFTGQCRFNKWQITGALSLTQSTIQELDPSYDGDYQIGDRIFDVPRRVAGLTALYRPSPSFLIHGGLESTGSWTNQDLVAFTGALFGDIPSRPSGRDYWMTYPGYTKLRIGIEQKLWKHVSGILEIENATAERAFEGNNVNIPGTRIFTLALRTPY